jgi:hypothetical protein
LVREWRRQGETEPNLEGEWPKVYKVQVKIKIVNEVNQVLNRDQDT